MEDFAIFAMLHDQKERKKEDILYSFQLSSISLAIALPHHPSHQIVPP